MSFWSDSLMQATPYIEPGTDIVLFDGVCVMCNGWIDFVLRRDPYARFRFGALQSDAAATLLSATPSGEPADPLSSVILIEKGVVYHKSTAALRVMRRLTGLWPALYILILVPRPIRDFCYDWVGRHRYAWFGQHDTCPMPSAEKRDRFLPENL